VHSLAAPLYGFGLPADSRDIVEAGKIKIAPFDHSGNSVPATEIISARPELGPIWGVRRRGE
jgi:hypothetical protein